MKARFHAFEPEMIEGPVYACGDIHGRLDLLEEFLAWVAEDAQGPASVVFLGDYIDRGPHSRQVIEKLIAGPSRRGERWYPIKGNHEAMMVAAWRYHTDFHIRNWMVCGASATLRSYGTGNIRSIPESHIRFLEDLPLGLDDGERLYVHAGVRPGVPLWRQLEHDLLWIREPFLSEAHGIERVVVHGHTPEFWPIVLPQRVGLDIGGYRTGSIAGARFDLLVPEARLWIGSQTYTINNLNL
ncbi:metallophosphoesterase family protein [Methylobacterium sp. WL8]|uniref:metallophosphoesterase family protein n=1 Tax=Methylobacterium sp. WL8 TaxID=2603899 RepID=UPI00164FC882|nr:metallophosphoesterase family protein [Methylobacterium sp. WL8]